MRRKQLLAVFAFGLVALAAATYFLVGHSPRSSADMSGASLPEPAAMPATEPSILKPANESPTTAETTAQAPASELATAAADHPSSTSRSFRELQGCVYAYRELLNVKTSADCSVFEGQPQFREAYADCLAGQRDVRSRVAAAQAAASMCDDADMGKRYFEATKQAAKNGDVDAQLCYLRGDFFSPEGTLIFTDAELEEYKKVAPRYVDGAFKHGDWRVVALLSTRRPHPDGGPSHLLEGFGDRPTIYKMTKLLRLGASGPYADFLDDQLEGMIHAPMNPALALPPEVVKDGDAWAQQTYTEYFAGGPGLTEAPVVCGPERG
jgi:hypothetical protein